MSVEQSESLEYVLDSAGTLITPANWPQTLGYSGSNLTTITAVAPGGAGTWVQTFTYSGTLVATISQWVKQ